MPPETFPLAVPGAVSAGEYDLLTLGDSYPSLVRVLQEASASTGIGVRGFHDMTPAEIAAITAVSADVAVLSKQREFDEPFTIPGGEDPAPLLRAIESAGKNWTQGGRFYHVIGDNDKTRAVEILIDLYRQKFGAITTVGLGDGPNDAGFLNLVDMPVIIRSRKLDRMKELVPRGRVTEEPGPAGWNRAVMELLS